MYKMHLYTRIALLMAVTLVANCNSILDGISQGYEGHREGKYHCSDSNCPQDPQDPFACYSVSCNRNQGGSRCVYHLCEIKEIENGSVIGIVKKNGKRSRIPNCEDDFIFNGNDCIRETQHDDTIEVDCDEGYQLCGNKYFKCQNGTWVDTEDNRIKELPTCEKPYEGAVYEGGDVIIMENGIFSSPKLPNKNKYTAKVCTNRVKQIKLQIDMVIKNPTQGKCTEKLMIKSNKQNVTIPELCGNITDQTLYIDMRRNRSPFEMIVVSLESSEGRLSPPNWNIGISFPKSSERVPKGCLQYHRTPTGTLQSFNFGGMALTNQKYKICFENSYGYKIDRRPYSLLFNFTTFDVGEKKKPCEDDYLIIDNKKHCGNETNKIVEVKGVPNDDSDDNLRVRVRMDDSNDDQEKGFSGTYTLKKYSIEPCTAEMDEYEGIHIIGNGGLFISPKQPNEMRRMSNKRTRERKIHKHTAKLCPGALVKQIELKVDMVIKGLNESNKCTDRLEITDSRLLPLNLPVLCGIVTNQTFYIDIVDHPGPYEITVSTMDEDESSSESSSPMSDGELKHDELTSDPYWHISISFLTQMSAAPYKCLQYHKTPTGTLQSFNQFEWFNYDDPNYKEAVGYISDSYGYIICFAYIPGYCDVEFNFTRFDLENNESDCYTDSSTDYLFIGDEKHCGDKNNKVVKVDASGPITIGVSMCTKKLQEKGFFGTYRMIPCGKHTPTTVSNSSLVASVWEMLVNPCVFGKCW